MLIGMPFLEALVAIQLRLVKEGMPWWQAMVTSHYCLAAWMRLIHDTYECPLV